MSRQPTPGPWKAKTLPEHGYTLVAPDGDLLAIEMIKADAILAAAAHDMLQALEACAVSIQHVRETGLEWSKAQIDAFLRDKEITALAAIAKARGKGWRP